MIYTILAYDGFYHRIAKLRYDYRVNVGVVIGSMRVGSLPKKRVRTGSVPYSWWDFSVFCMVSGCNPSISWIMHVSNGGSLNMLEGCNLSVDFRSDLPGSFYPSCIIAPTVSAVVKFGTSMLMTLLSTRDCRSNPVVGRFSESNVYALAAASFGLLSLEPDTIAVYMGGLKPINRILRYRTIEWVRFALPAPRST